MNAPSRLIAAIDTADAVQAARLIAALRPHVGLIKLGLEVFCAHGPACLDWAGGAPVFLDLKLHDIPNTVAGAMRALLGRPPAMVTLHAAGGAAMITAARTAAEAAGSARPRLLAVTVLTSLAPADLAATGVMATPGEQVLRLARLALDAGADGLVCSASEIGAIRAAFGAEPILVVPGIRPIGSAQDDQARTATPAAAMAAGADYLVVGRPITQAADPAAAAAAIGAEMAVAV
ncbi:MAG TPA: orotidine-5'-phosphate decarboxylase [Acidiphilium sp.]|nr:MAG: orotidine 5'-phosphate decarboxylase [Acidiphilium sp. 21-60-14]OYV90130.1 MAG: orotidine 5'-phosphate decarboxylase [Acidiphilium sp. 37-60-79]HQT88875.1 orotidine-5'-phosphate decarboxylase [Acidiphilium sp.]HQU25093.1 orotidine-5'-phosphate decarboxylase [Acidiphilium sp.]